MVITAYRQERDEKTTECHIHSEETSICPLCSGALRCFGRRKRVMIQNDGGKQKLHIRRRKCQECGKIHHELPDMLVPYKRYSVDSIEKIIAGDTKEVVCEESTIRRIRTWWDTCRLYFESIIASLREKYKVHFSANMAPREMFRAAANAHLWPATRSVFLTV